MRRVRSRRDTRSAVLSYLWQLGGSFRPSLAESVDLTEASISRIIAELKAEGVIEETRRTAAYQGGPSAFLTLSKDAAVAALEISNSRIHVAVGTLTGEILHSERHDLPDGLDAAGVETVLARAIEDLADWSHRRCVTLEQIAASIPGYHPGRSHNPIVALDPLAFAARIKARFPGTDLMLANSMVTRAVAHRLQAGASALDGPYLFVFAGHGVGAAFVEDVAGAVEPCEIGHMVVEQPDVPCRCGHSGCLEAYVSTAALADILGVQEPDLIAHGDRWFHEFRISARAWREIQERLTSLGIAIGNTLNARRYRKVVVTGWPSTLPEEDRGAVHVAIDQALLGGAEGVELSFAPANFGREPASGLALATFSFIRRGGERVRSQDEALEA